MSVAALPRRRRPAAMSPQSLSLRARLLLGILVPVLLLLVVNAVMVYRQGLAAADTAYDRTLLASAKSIGELLSVQLEGDRPRVQANLLYSALEAFEADNRSRLFYKVSGFDGEMVSGFEDLPAWRGRLPDRGPYAALVAFYDDEFRGEPVRVGVLLQPVAGVAGQGMATIQVAETLELRRTLARQMLIDTLWWQAALLGVIALVVIWVVQRVTAPVRDLSERLRLRDDGDLDPITLEGAPRELTPLLEATNQVMARLRQALDHQKRFVRDASHQLRTPLAVLKTQVQSARRGDLPAQQALAEIDTTVERATVLANQMLALAKVEQLRQQASQGDRTEAGSTEPTDGLAPVPRVDLAEVVRAVSLDLAPLIAERQLDFELEAAPAPILSHEWPLRELARNLMHNAIRHTPPHGRLMVRTACRGQDAVLCVSDSGPGIDSAQRTRLFEPFAAGDPRSGSGLGLTICKGIVESLGGSIQLDNRVAGSRVQGLDAIVLLRLSAGST
jgi:two-component system, OmpR family, sensor histidine kinase TctE